MHLFEPLTHELEGFTEPFLKCPLQFFVNGGAHLFDLLRVVLLQFLQAKIDNRTNALERFAQLLALAFRNRRALFAVARKFIAQAAIE